MRETLRYLSFWIAPTTPINLGPNEENYCEYGDFMSSMMMDLTILLLWFNMIDSMQLIRTLQKDCSFDELYQDDDDDDDNDGDDSDNNDDDDDNDDDADDNNDDDDDDSGDDDDDL